MKKRVIIFIAGILSGVVAGVGATALFFRYRVAETQALDNAVHVAALHRALRIADSKDIERTQARLASELNTALLLIVPCSEQHGSPNAKKVVRKAREYVENRKTRGPNNQIQNIGTNAPNSDL